MNTLPQQNRLEYAAWNNARQRCTKEHHPQYHNYGARGITMCAEWTRSFAQFFADMGPKPPGSSLDRIDNDGHYEKTNCRWADWTTQANNRRKPRPRTKRRVHKLDPQAVAHIKTRPDTAKNLAAKYNVTTAAIYLVWSDKWSSS